jgi:hypothetical protein
LSGRKVIYLRDLAERFETKALDVAACHTSMMTA